MSSRFQKLEGEIYRFPILFILFASLLILGVVPVVPVSYAATEQAAPRVGIIQGNIWYSYYPFFSGETINVYTAIWNGGEKRVRGVLAFTDNGVEFGRQGFTMSPVELREISVKWTPKEGEHKISAFIVEAYVLNGGKEELVTLDNKQTGEQIFFVDNDTDGDGTGDKEDQDIDGDGLENEKERQLGTDPFKKDSDGDGIDDKKDSDPLNKPVAETGQKNSEQNAGADSLIGYFNNNNDTGGTLDTVKVVANNVKLLARGPIKNALLKGNTVIENEASVIKSKIDDKRALLVESLKTGEQNYSFVSDNKETEGAGKTSVKKPLAYVSLLALGVLSFILENQLLLYAIFVLVVFTLISFLTRRYGKK